jgi:hypothetical protein
MGFLSLFKSSRSPGLPPLPSGSYTVDREGKVVTRTISSSVSAGALEQISAQVLQTFREAKQANLNIHEFTINTIALNIKARELRGGAIIFLSPRGTGRK